MLLLVNLQTILNHKNKQDDIDKKLKLQFQKHKIFIAASTHENEELFAVKTHMLLKILT